MAQWKEIEPVKPIDKALYSKVSSSSGRTLQERRCSLVTRKFDGRASQFGAKTADKENKTDCTALYPSAGYQRRHDEKDKTSTGEALPAQ